MKPKLFIRLTIITMAISGGDLLPNDHVYNIDRDCKFIRMMDLFILSGGKAKNSSYYNSERCICVEDSVYIEKNYPLFYTTISALSGIPTGYRMRISVFIEDDEYQRLNQWYNDNYSYISCSDVAHIVELENSLAIDSLILRLVPQHPENITLDEYGTLRVMQIENVDNKMDSIGKVFRERHHIKEQTDTLPPNWIHYY